LGALFRLADRDGDGRVTPKEFETFLALHAQGAQSFITATASDQSPGLFELLDESGDGRLSLRELYTAHQRLQKLMGENENALEHKHLPRRLGLEISRGGPTPRAAKAEITTAEQSSRAGPAWFRRMDRNGDGYVSRREFLGSLAQFKLLDQDGDGLISPAEAEKLQTSK
jgi:Ca2+-binding EF-hand superfamily protein